MNKQLLKIVLVGIVSCCLIGSTEKNNASAEENHPVTTAENRTAINKGVDFERSRRWIDAINHYEKSLKTWSQSKPLQYGLRRSKIHFGIERRYADESFENQLLSKSRYSSLVLFDEILSRVRRSYVQQISSTSFVAHGTESLYLALSNPKFLKKNLPEVSAERVAKLRKILREQYWNKPIQNQTDARRVVETVCNTAYSTTGLSASTVVMEYIFGGCNSLDDYSHYLSPNRLKDLYGNIEGEFVGLGIEMKEAKGKGMLLVNIIPDSPAEEGGMKAGERIVAVDGVDCRNMTTDEAAKLLRGLSGSRVRLRLVSRGSEEERVSTFTRRAVLVKSIPVVKMVDRRSGVGYIQMTGFQKSSAAELDAALAKLKSQGMTALIWDLRGNPGGLLTASVEVLDRFISDGVIVSTKGRTQDQNWSYSARRIGTHHMPLVVLVDGDSASASEIVSGAVKDHRRGKIVGRQTYGKWSVQSILPIRGNTGLRLTTAKFYSPKGRNYSKVGIKPDVIVEKEEEENFVHSIEDLTPEKDDDIRKGVELLNSQLARRK
ncbi:Carboxyl-terminal protease [hydrothermal vent metagenome]|uniref:Carboxyl-terminal protease n=1 Tax=hydrothermal vent metagenome TaxID=652676 RepID=A0A3B1D8A8_9ZZZZ